MNEHMHDDWETLFEQLPLDVTPDSNHQSELKERVLAAWDNPAVQRPPHRFRQIGHVLMKYKIPQWTTAMVIAGCLLWFANSGSTRAFAIDEAIENLSKAKTAKFDMTVKVIGQPEQKMHAIYKEPGHFRQELGSGIINIADWSQGKMVGLVEPLKQATVISLVNIPESNKQKMQVNQFEAIRDLLREANKDPKSQVESLGTKTMEGREVVGFHFKSPVQPMTVWIDPSTKFPVQIESKLPGPPETQVTMSNFEFNVELDDSLFSLEIPEGYEVMELKMDASTPTEQDFITSLKMGSEGENGKFPPGFDAVAMARYVAEYLTRQGLTKENKVSAEQLQTVAKMARGFQFVAPLTTNSDAHYAGKDAKPGDQERAIFWYKPADSKMYRVIYADLSVKESAAAPDVEGAVKLTP